MINENFDDGDRFYLSDEENVEEVNRFVVFFFNFVEVMMSTLVAVMLTILFVVRVVWVSERSMEHTLSNGDGLFILSYFFTKPKYKDIIIVNGVGIKDCDLLIVKRVIATEGDVVDIKKNKVYVNGVELDEPYALGRTFPGDDISYPFTVPKGYLFYLGDNRERSGDARRFGIIPLDRVSGRAIVRLFPLSKFSKL